MSSPPERLEDGWQATRRPRGRRVADASPRWRHTANPAAFTLIELLVVIAVIMLLAALLFPSLRLARTRAERIACLSIQRSLHVAAVSFAADADGYLPFSFGGTAYWGYWQHRPNIIWPNHLNALYRFGDWDSVWAGDLALDLRKGNNGRGGQLAPYVGGEKTSSTSNTGTSADAWREMYYRDPGGGYSRYYLPRRIATCPSVRPVTGVQTSSTVGNYQLDTYMGTGQQRLPDNNDFFPSYGINPFITGKGSVYWAEAGTAVRYYEQFKLSQINYPSKLFLFADRPHALMDWQPHSYGTADPGIGIGFLAPLAHMLPDLFAPAAAGAYGPYAPEPRHEMAVAVFVDGHAETMLWSNYRKTAAGTSGYTPGKAFPGSGYNYPQYVWPGLYENNEYHDFPFVNRMPASAL